MKRLWNKFSDKYLWLIILAILLIVFFVIAGFSIDQTGFAGNILAEGTGILISIFVALFVVDKYVAKHEKQQWSKVCNITYSALAYGIGKIFAGALYSFESEYGDKEIRMLNNVLNPGNETIDAMGAIISIMQETEGSVLGGNARDVEARAKTFYDNLNKFQILIQPEVNQIRNVLIPRLLLFSKDQSFINSMIVLDQATQFGYDTIEQVFIMMKAGVGVEILHEKFGNWVSILLSATKDVYTEIWKVWKPSLPHNNSQRP